MLTKAIWTLGNIQNWSLLILWIISDLDKTQLPLATHKLDTGQLKVDLANHAFSF